MEQSPPSPRLLGEDEGPPLRAFTHAQGGEPERARQDSRWFAYMYRAGRLVGIVPTLESHVEGFSTPHD